MQAVELVRNYSCNVPMPFIRELVETLCPILHAVTGTIAPGPYIVLTVINGVGPATFVPWTGANVIANART